MPELKIPIEKIQSVFDFKTLRDSMRQEIKKADDETDAFFGKREPFLFFDADASMEPERNKVVKVSSVITAVNLMVATFMVRTWPKVLKQKFKEFAGIRAAGKSAAVAVGRMKLPDVAKGLAGTVKEIFTALAKSKAQETSMQNLENDIRKPSAKVRASFNDTALSQAVKPSRIGSTSTRHEVTDYRKPPRANKEKKPPRKRRHKAKPKPKPKPRRMRRKPTPIKPMRNRKKKKNRE